MREIVLFNMGNEYECEEMEWMKEQATYNIDLSALPGTNCYCDDIAAEVIRDSISNVPLDAMHFFGSGNYHYLSYFWLERIPMDFVLVVFDHHPDAKADSIGGLLSCGNWVQYALEHCSHLQRVYYVGTNRELYQECVEEGTADYGSKTRLGDTLSDMMRENTFPVYLSIDKDVLTEEDARCDWNQGDLKLKELMTELAFMSEGRILGIDICGEKKEKPFTCDLATNLRTNQKLISFLQQNN